MAEEEETEISGEEEAISLVVETNEEKSARLALENEAAASAELAKKEAALQKTRDDRLASERPGNLARVQFKESVVKHIVSHHMSSIVGAADPIIKINDEVYAKLQSTFAEFASSGATEGEEGEGGEGTEGDDVAEDGKEGDEAETSKFAPEPSIPYDHNTLAQLLYQCGLTPVEFNVSEIGPSDDGEDETEQEDDADAKGEEGAGPAEGDEVEGNEEAEVASARLPRKAALAVKSKSQRLLDLVKLYVLDTLTPGRPITESTFIDFVHKFYAPAYYYGQHLRRYAGRGCIEDVLDLFTRGCSVNTSDGEGLSALHYASEFNRVELIEAMSVFAGKSLMVNGKDKAGWTPLYCAVHHGNMEVVKLLLKMPASDSARDSISKIVTIYGKTTLHACAAQGRVEIAEFLLKQPEVNLKSKDKHGLTALHQAAFSGETLVYNLLLSDSKCDDKLVNMRESLKYTADTYMEEKNGAKGLDSSLYEDTIEMSGGTSAVFSESKSEAKSESNTPVGGENDAAEKEAA